MSNQLATQQRISLTSILDLNKNKTEIKQFDQFISRNSPYYNDGISPLYKKESTGAVMDSMGNTYDYADGYLRKNGSNLMEVGTEFTKIEEMAEQPPENVELFDWDNTEGILYQSGPKELTYKKGDYTKIIDLSSYSFDFIQSIQYMPTVNEFAIGCQYNRGSQYFRASIFTREFFIITIREVNPILHLSYYNDNQAIQIDNNSPIFVTPYYYNGQRIYFFSSPSDRFINRLSVNAYYTGGSTHWLSLKIKDSLQNTVKFKGVISLPYDENEKIILHYFDITDDKFTIDTYPVLSCTFDNLTITNDEIVLDTYSIVGSDSNSVNCKKVNWFYDGREFYINVIYSKAYSTREYQVADLNTNKKVYSFVGFSDGYGWNFVESKKSDNQLYRVMYNKSASGSVISGICTPSGYLPVPFLDVDNTSELPVKNLLYPVYKSVYSKKWVKLITTSQPTFKVINGRYITLNVYGYYRNCYDSLKDEITSSNIAYNDNLVIYCPRNKIPGDSSGQRQVPVYDEINYIASGVNENFETGDKELSSANFSPYPIIYNVIYRDTQNTQTGDIASGNVAYTGLINVDAEDYPVYINDIDIYGGTTEDGVLWLCKFRNNIKQENGELKGTTYPIPTDNNILLPPSYNTQYFESGILSDYIKEGDTYFNLVYSEGKPIQLYTYGTGLKNASASFVIQGQRFAIRNGVICSADISNGLLTVGEGIVNINTMMYLGATPLTAYFYSPATHYIYQFTGDRNITIAFESSEIEDIVTSYYDANSCTIYFASSDSLYCIYNTYDGNVYMYKKELPGITSIVSISDGCFAVRVGPDTWYTFSLYKRDSFVKEPVTIKTHYYGVGDNRVSVIDTWYLRLFSEDAVDGDILLKVETITDGIARSETKQIHINKRDWLSNGYYYIRYQPQLQRGAGISLEIVKSDFAITDIQASYNPDTTIQLTKNTESINHTTSI